MLSQNKEHENQNATETKCAEIEGIAKNAQNENYDIATFSNEAPVCAVGVGDANYHTLHQDISDDSLRRVLERPVIVAAGSFGAGPGTVASASAGSSAALRNLFNPAQWDRMLGYLGIRFTLKFTVTVSKTAFHQGVVSFCWQYGTDLDNKFRGSYFPLSVNLPNVRLNMAEETIMSLSIPFVYSEEYVPIAQLNLTQAAYGCWALVNLTGCPVVAGQSLPKYTIYCSMEDVELIGHQPFVTGTVTTQSGLHSKTNLGTIRNTAQSKSKIEQEGHAQGVLSGTVESLANAASSFAMVPGLSSVGGAADWFLRSTSGALQAFGFSKPLDETLPHRAVRSAYAGDGQTDIPNIGYAMAPFQSNKLAIDGSLGCTEIDEMALDYVLTKYSYIYKGNFTTSQAPNDVIYSAPVTPSAFYYRDFDLGVSSPTGNIALKTANTLTENTFLPSTLCYVGDNFRYWRGNLKFRVTFACTKLHGGRVMFSYVPVRNTDTVAGVPISNVRRIPAGSAIGPHLTGDSLVFDLQDGTTFEFEVPYTGPKPYCGVLTEHTGDVSMIVVAPLTANSTVPSTVNFMVEVCAMPGFEFACICPSLMSTVPLSGVTAVTYQSGLTPLEVKNEASEQCIGEVIKSLKTLIQSPDYYAADATNNTTTVVSLDPWFKANAPALPVTAATPLSVTAQGLYFAAKSSRMAEMYAYVRGNTTYSCFRDRVGGVTHSFKITGDDGGSAAATNGSFYDKTLNLYGTANIPESLDSSRVVIPLYAKVARIATRDRDFAFGGERGAPTLATFRQSITTSRPTLTVRNASGSTVRYLVGRAAADDAMMAQFIGPPPTLVLNTLASVNPVFGNGVSTDW